MLFVLFLTIEHAAVAFPSLASSLTLTDEAAIAELFPFPPSASVPPCADDDDSMGLRDESLCSDIDQLSDISDPTGDWPEVS